MLTTSDLIITQFDQPAQQLMPSKLARKSTYSNNPLILPTPYDSHTRNWPTPLRRARKAAPVFLVNS